MAIQPTKVGGHNVEFVEALDSRYKCPICDLALRSPHQTKCGHRFCEGCIREIIRSGSKLCPMDRSELTEKDVFKDAFCNREILDMICFCPYKKVGCAWKDRLGLLEKHNNEDCQFVEVKCPNNGCKVKVERRYLERHLQGDCLFKRATCGHCGIEVSQRTLKDHYTDCPKVKVTCPKSCGAEVARDNLAQHFATECPAVEADCPYVFGACGFQGPRANLEGHLQNASVEHASMLADQVNKTKGEIDILQEKITALVQHVERLEQQITTQNDELGDIRDNVAQLRPVLENHERQIQDILKPTTASSRQPEVDSTSLSEIKKKVQKVEEQVGKLQVWERQSIGRTGTQAATHSTPKDPMAIGRRLERVEHQITLSDVQMAEHDVRISVQETTSYEGYYIWKIDDLGRRIHEAVNGKTLSVYSPPFYVKRFGYKVCTRVYLNGDGMGKGTHISLFFVIMRGTHDALLPWPFRQKVTFKLIDQGGDQHITDSFLPDPKSSSFQRPTSNMNIASGCPLFLPKSVLGTRGYSKDDCLFFEINVDLDGLPLLYF